MRSPARGPRASDPKDLNAARAIALKLLARRAWGRRELERRLEERGAPKEVARACVEDLETRGYLNDAQFARSYAEGRARARKLGSQRLREELARKGIERQTVEAALREVYEEVPETQLALEAAGKRLGQLHGKVERAPTKLRDYLLRRGFSAEVVAATLRKLLRGDARVEQDD